jgi:hypothetical protein
LSSSHRRIKTGTSVDGGVGVGKGRSETHGNTTTGIANTGTVRDCTVVKIPKVTWADVVRKSANMVKDPVVASNARKIPAIPSNGFVGNNKRTKRMSVLKRSFSENNPVNSVEV